MTGAPRVHEIFPDQPVDNGPYVYVPRPPPTPPPNTAPLLESEGARYWRWRPKAAWDDEEVEITAVDGAVNLAVTEEQAVDSYNQKFTCDARMPLEAVRSLRDFLTAVLDAAEPKDPPP